MAMSRAEESEDLKERVSNLIEMTTWCVYQYTNRALFECDKLTFTSKVAFEVYVLLKQCIDFFKYYNYYNTIFFV